MSLFAIGDAAIGEFAALPMVAPTDPVTDARGGNRMRSVIRKMIIRHGREEVEIERAGVIIGRVPAWIRQVAPTEMAGELDRRNFEIAIAAASLAAIGAEEALMQRDIIRRKPDLKPNGDENLTIDKPPLPLGVGGVLAVIEAEASAA